MGHSATAKCIESQLSARVQALRDVLDRGRRAVHRLDCRRRTAHGGAATRIVDDAERLLNDMEWDLSSLRALGNGLKAGEEWEQMLATDEKRQRRVKPRK